jgi:hypothetical protein
MSFGSSVRLLDVILVLGGMETNTNVLDALHSPLNPESTVVTCSSSGFIFSHYMPFLTNNVLHQAICTL